jgi:hypothetical protein
MKNATIFLPFTLLFAIALCTTSCSSGDSTQVQKPKVDTTQLLSTMGKPDTVVNRLWFYYKPNKAFVVWGDSVGIDSTVEYFAQNYIDRLGNHLPDSLWASYYKDSIVSDGERMLLKERICTKMNWNLSTRLEDRSEWLAYTKYSPVAYKAVVFPLLDKDHPTYNGPEAPGWTFLFNNRFEVLSVSKQNGSTPPWELLKSESSLPMLSGMAQLDGPILRQAEAGLRKHLYYTLDNPDSYKPLETGYMLKSNHPNLYYLPHTYSATNADNDKVIIFTLFCFDGTGKVTYQTNDETEIAVILKAEAGRYVR